jgi:enoyl-CoA hydratase/carnithine racemase
MSSAVTLRRVGTSLHVTVDRPAKLNALRRADIDAMLEAMDLDADVRAVVFRGAGDRAFSAGMHVEEFQDLTPASAAEFISRLRDLLAAVRTAPVATVSAVNGYCIGAAFELALACDLRIAASTASFGLPEIKVGIPSVVDAALLPQHVGLSLAKEMILTGDLYPVDRFAASGMCNAVVEPDELDAEVERWVARVAGHTRAATASQKRLFEVWQNTGLSTGTALSVREFASVFAAEETRQQLNTYRRGL